MADKKPLESQEQDQGKLDSFEMPTSGAIDRSEFRDEIEVVNEFAFTERAEQDKFMHELVLVEVMPTTDKNAEFIIPLNVNGVVQNMIRGQHQWIKRKYLEVLARAKTVNVSTQEYVNVQSEKGTRIVRNAAVHYPFRVIEDKNPKGYPWLQQILSEAS